MAQMKQYSPRGIVMGRLKYGADLLEEITGICRREQVQMGRVEAIGAVSAARMGFYDQTEKEYRFYTIEEPLEIVSLSGNVSRKDGDVMVHAHVVFSNEKGEAFGGHLAPGTTVFACECIVELLDGPILERHPDQETGLPLWNL